MAHERTVTRDDDKARQAVIDAAAKFVLHTWADAESLEGGDLANHPNEFINLHDAVCKLKGWKRDGGFPESR